MTPTQKLDERRARAIIGAIWQPHERPSWEEFTEAARIEAIAQARAIRESDEAAGLVVVPREATLEMINSHEKEYLSFAAPTGEVWANMIAASPYTEPSP